jgi:hypothetical protein
MSNIIKRKSVHIRLPVNKSVIINANGVIIHLTACLNKHERKTFRFSSLGGEFQIEDTVGRIFHIDEVPSNDVNQQELLK